MSLAALLFASLLGATPAFIAKFPTVKLPLVLAGQPHGSASDVVVSGPGDLKSPQVLGAAEVISNLLEPISKAHARNGDGLMALRALWSPAAQAGTRRLLAARDGGAQETLELSAVCRVLLKDSQALLVRQKQTQTTAGSAQVYLYLLTFTLAGAWVDGNVLGLVTGELELAYGFTLGAKLLADGSFTRDFKLEIAGLQIMGGSPEYGGLIMTVRSESKGSVGAGGKFSLGDSHCLDWAGRFVDATSKEVLTIFDGEAPLAVYYQPATNKPHQRLKATGGGTTGAIQVRFERSPKPYLLSFEEGGEQLYCKDSDGKQQTFVRDPRTSAAFRP